MGHSYQAPLAALRDADEELWRALHATHSTGTVGLDPHTQALAEVALLFPASRDTIRRCLDTPPPTLRHAAPSITDEEWAEVIAGE